MTRSLIMGGVIGLVCGMIFGALYFGPGQLTAPMAYVHDVSGTGLGILIAWIVGLQKKASAAKK